ncbi:hypothetical protein F8M41_004589 [Gigaspora margarita]|uniref:ZSWIM1/3 RNaseH-like domain-containing protein n=1 Tax=Gigaspora margarita TaxID=4874 RepID=A0A8H4AXK3_GIGMA|nr:hypothetical protein F8M41_004589 [Gigaspora margarita]
MSTPPEISEIFDIEEEDQEIDMELDNNNIDNIIDSILDATDSVGHMWESVDDCNTISSVSNNERVKVYSLPMNEYVTWIRDLEKGGLSYVRHDRRSNWCSAKRKNLWTERCLIRVILPINSSNVVLHHYYKHTNHYPGHLSDLCTMPLSENIRAFVQTRDLAGLNAFSIQRLLRFRAVEFKDQIRMDTEGHLQNVQMLRDAFITWDDIYAIVYNVMKKLIHFDKNELISLEKWKEKLSNAGGNCLFERDTEFEFLFAFQTKDQINLIEFGRVMCLDSTHGMNHHGFHLFSIIMRHPITGNGYSVAFLISKFKQSSTLNRWFNFLKDTNENFSPDIFMVDDAGEEIKAVEESFPDSSVLLCHFHILHSWCKRLGHKHGANINPNKAIVWKDLWKLMRTEGWNDAEAQQQIIKAINR